MSEAKPITWAARVHHYAQQNGPGRQLTARQVRRLRKKRNKELGVRRGSA